MQKTFFLLISGCMIACAALGQDSLRLSPLPRTLRDFQPPGSLRNFPPPGSLRRFSPPGSIRDLAGSTLSLIRRWDPIRVLAPDHMSCLVPDLAGVEHMPIRYLSNDNPVDRIPNACPPALKGPLTNGKIAVPPERKN